LEALYIGIVVVLFLLAASDLIVGVSNDAVNFLNSAIGSKVASFKVIMAVAAVGILFGSVFSSGMMEVARKGIFHPQMFYFHEIMLIFLAVMITDVIMLDTFNTIGMPTSTTVSIVFELLGAAVAMASIKIISGDPGAIGQYINSGKALAIISGILVSVAIAFTVGVIIQYIVRLAFSFNFRKRIKYIGAIWGGISLSVITYFLVIKGMKNVEFIPQDFKTFVQQNTLQVMLVSFIGWTVVLQLFNILFKLNILKFIVLAGTFGLAMAFAGNDLVNFIGVPIAGFNSWQFFHGAQGADPHGFLMTGLAGKVPTNTLFLVVAGIVMILTLYFSRKAKSVIKTSVDLSRQDEGDERFGSSWIAKILVRYSIKASDSMRRVVPKPVLAVMEKQFVPYREELPDEETAAAFDLVRASVNLVVASVLIAIGTSLKLPLSTTYVTFMVAMGTSLADNAWDRESAVYRITGMFAVIAGWFLTALIAFTMAFAILYLLNYLSFFGILLMVVIAAVVVYRSHVYHKRKTEEDTAEDLSSFSDETIVDKSMDTILLTLGNVVNTYDIALEGLQKEDMKKLKKAKKTVRNMTVKTKYLKDHINVIVEKLQEDSISSGSYFVQVIDYLREMVHSVEYVVVPILNHVDNNHRPLKKEQIKELKEVYSKLERLIQLVARSIKSRDFSSQDEVLLMLEEYLKLIESLRKGQIKRVKNNVVGTKNTILFLNILNESKNLGLQVVNLFKSQRDFVRYKNE
jgi:phosphate/sulfate permease